LAWRQGLDMHHCPALSLPAYGERQLNIAHWAHSVNWLYMAGCSSDVEQPPGNGAHSRLARGSLALILSRCRGAGQGEGTPGDLMRAGSRCYRRLLSMMRA